MKTLRMVMTLIIGSASAAYAAAGTQTESAGILAYAFIGFFALIVVSQLVPAMILFFGMVKGVLTGKEKTSVGAE